ncbi:MAG: DMT family transporter [Oligoflexia bacterium]|nr:DMT family transporter [Oligoflexia bacterium]
MMLGAVIALGGAALHAAKDIISKSLSSRVDGATSTFASFAFAIPFYLAALFILWLTGLEDFALTPAFWTWIVLRSLSDVCAEWFKMHSFTHGDLSVVSSLVAMSPVVLLIVSPLVTGDVPSLLGIVGVCISVSGTAVMLYRPRNSATRSDLRSIGLALLSAFFFAMNACFDRLAVRTASPTLSGFAMTVGACIIVIPSMVGKPQRWSSLAGELRRFSARGLLEFVFMVAKLSALQYMQAPYVVALLRSSVLFSVFGGRMFFAEGGFRRRLFAALLIVVGIACVLLGA